MPSDFRQALGEGEEGQGPQRAGSSYSPAAAWTGVAETRLHTWATRRRSRCASGECEKYSRVDFVKKIAFLQLCAYVNLVRKDKIYKHMIVFETS